MNTKNTIFLKQSKPIDFTLLLVSLSSWKFLAITTSLAIVGAASEFIYSQFPFNYQAALIVCIMVFYVIIDMGIVPMFKFWLNFKESKNPHEKKYINIVFLFLFLKVAISLTSSIWASPEAAGVITQNNKPIAEQKKQELESSHDAKIIKAEKAYLEAKKNLKSDIANHIKLNADKYQKASIRNIGINGWICHPANKDKKDISLCNEIRAIENTPTQLKATYQAILADPNHKALVEDYTQEIITSGAEFKNQMSRRTGYFIYLDIIALIFGLGAEYMRHIRRKATNTTDIETPTLFFLFGNFIGKKQKEFLYWLEELLGRDIDGDGYTGKPTTSKNYRTQNTITASVPVKKRTPKKNTQKEEHPTNKEHQNTKEQNTQKPSANKDYSTEHPKLGRIVFINQKPMYEHIKDDGTPINMRKGECNGRLRNAATRLNETMIKINKGTTNEQVLVAEKNRRENVKYWQSAVNLFNNYVSN